MNEQMCPPHASLANFRKVNWKLTHSLWFVYYSTLKHDQTCMVI